MKGEVRNPMMVWAIALFTCGVGQLFFLYTFFDELKRYLGREDINPLVELLIAWLCLPFGLMRLGGYLHDAQKRAGIANAENQWVMLTLLSLCCLYGFAKIQEEMNRIWQSGGSAPATF